ncbi:MAG: hypothetical protein ACREXW_06570 [Gammaproteobacteria bacterium]
MSTKVYVARLGETALATLIATLWVNGSCAILERPDKIKFPGPSEPIDPVEWPIGRVFNDQNELHWERDGDAYQARLTGGDGLAAPPEFDEVLALDDSDAERVWYYLWGEDEIAIGGRLNYSRAIPGPGRGQLGINEYRDQDGRLVFYHYAGLRRE